VQQPRRLACSSLCDPDVPSIRHNVLTFITPLRIASIWGAVYLERPFVGLETSLAETVDTKLWWLFTSLI
jgi:hypothetical protein